MDGDPRSPIPSRIDFLNLNISGRMRELILASGSSRRHSLLKQLNLEYRVCVSNIDESAMVGEAPTEYVCRIARVKALAVYESLMASQVVLAADTIIALDGKIIGKPENIQHAKSILQKLSAAEHEVLTALCLKTQDHDYETMVSTKVKFRQLTNSEIEAYCLTHEPYDKAGAYAIQGLASSFVEYISGSYTNVMGLPLSDVCSLLKQASLYNFDDV